MIGTPETFSMLGSTAQLCVEHAPHLSSVEKHAHAKRASKRPPAERPPVPADAIPDGTCARCGVVGTHRTPDACIEALRSEIAGHEFCREELSELRKKVTLRSAAPDPKPPAAEVPTPARTTTTEVIMPTMTNLQSSYETVLRDLEREQAEVREQIALAQRKAADIDLAVAILARRTNVAKPEPAPPPSAPAVAPSDRYANLSLRQAIPVLVGESRRMSAGQIADALKAGGIRTASQHFVKIVSAALGTMKRAGEVRNRGGKWSLAARRTMDQSKPEKDTSGEPVQRAEWTIWHHGSAAGSRHIFRERVFAAVITPLGPARCAPPVNAG